MTQNAFQQLSKAGKSIDQKNGKLIEDISDISF